MSGKKHNPKRHCDNRNYINKRDGSIDYVCIKKKGSNLSCDFCNSKDTPSFPIENDISKKIVVQKGGDDLLVSENQQKAVKLYNELGSFSRVGKAMGISKQNANKLYQKGIGKFSKWGVTNKPVRLTNVSKVENRGVTVEGFRFRLHNDSFKIGISCDLDKIKGRSCKLKFTDYKLVKTEFHHIKVFRNTLTVRFLEDILGDSSDEVLVKADLRIKDYLLHFNWDGVTILDKSDKGFKLISRHYGLLGTGFAKKMIKEKKLIITYDPLDNSVRERIDFSNGKPEIDAENVLKGKSDIDRTKSIIEDWENNDVELMSVTKSRIDSLKNNYDNSLDVLKNEALIPLTEQIKLHLAVQQDTRELFKKDIEVKNETLNVLRDISFSLKKEKAKSLLSEYGW